jgi:hypothetical protein
MLADQDRDAPPPDLFPDPLTIRIVKDLPASLKKELEAAKEKAVRHLKRRMQQINKGIEYAQERAGLNRGDDAAAAQLLSTYLADKKDVNFYRLLAVDETVSSEVVLW